MRLFFAILWLMVFTLVFIVLSGFTLRGQEDIVVATGHVSANPTELDEGYVAVGQNVIIMFRKDDTVYFQRMKSFIGKTIELRVRVLPLQGVEK